MVEENVEVVRRFFAAMERFFAEYWNDRRSLAAALESGQLWPAYREAMSCTHPDAEWQTVFLGTTHRGHHEVARAWDDFLKWAEDYRVHLEEASELDADHVFAVLRLTGSGRKGRAPMVSRFFDVITLRDGVIVRIEEYSDRGRAMEAAGSSGA